MEGGSIDAAVGANLDMILKDHFAQLRNLVIKILRIGGIAKAVGADASVGMDFTVAAKFTIGTDMHQ